MIEKLTKGISVLIPFLADYPTWVRILDTLFALGLAFRCAAPGAPACSWPWSQSSF